MGNCPGRRAGRHQKARYIVRRYRRPGKCAVLCATKVTLTGRHIVKRYAGRVSMQRTFSTGVPAFCLPRPDGRPQTIARHDKNLGGTPVKNSGLLVSRRRLLQTAAGLAGGTMLPAGFVMPAYADDKPAIGTYPAGSSGSSVFIGISVPRTGTYAVQGEDELKGYELAIEHINSGHELIKKISPKTTKGLLGKELKYGVADSAAKPNEAVQAQQRFISENKAVMITGGTSSAVAVALNKLAQREKVLFVCGISGSNDTTGKDCVRYGVRQNFFGQTASAAIAPVLVKAFGKNKKVAYMTPDYTYGHTVTKSMQDNTAADGWTTVTNQVSPLGAPDFSSYLLNVANSGADILLNVNWGHDAVLSIQQAKQFGVLDKMKLVVPYQVPFLAR